LIQESLNHFNADNDISSELTEQSVEMLNHHSH